MVLEDNPIERALRYVLTEANGNSLVFQLNYSQIDFKNLRVREIESANQILGPRQIMVYCGQLVRELYNRLRVKEGETS